MPGLPMASCEAISERALFGGAITCSFPQRFQDVSNVRQVPDHQEVFVDPNLDESIIVDLVELQEDVSDECSAWWFLQDLAYEQDVSQDVVVGSMQQLTPNEVPFMSSSVMMSTAVSTLAISKGTQGRNAHNLVKVYLANLRLRNVHTDVLISMYQPMLISEQSESMAASGAGETVPAHQAELLDISEIFRHALSTFKICDWGLFVS